MRCIPFRALVAAAAVATLYGCAAVPPREPLPTKHPSTFFDAQRAFLGGDYESAATKFDASGKEQPGLSAEAAYWIGVCRLKQGQLNKAEGEFRRCLANKPGPTLELKARTGIGQSYQQRAQYSQAIKTYEQVLHSNSRYIERDLVSYNLGVCLVKSGDSARGRTVLQEVVARFPKSQWAPSAREMLKSGPSAKGAAGK